MKYDPKKIEKKWQKYWKTNKTFEVKEDAKKEKFYSLVEFPYPSGEGLHVGHPRPFTAMDVISRKKRMEGKNVLFPIGFDSFGLPTENYAIKTGKPPVEVTKKNITNFTRQLKMLGYSFDWSRVVDTSNPKYYKWTQWLFLQFFKHGLAYKKNQTINWCPKDKIGLANEEVVNGCCERCGTPVEKRNKEQWMLAITKYADKLLAGLKNVDYIERARVQQENWIGRSEGAEIDFAVVFDPTQPPLKKGGVDSPLFKEGLGEVNSLTVFTTRPDTIFGATFLAVSAELAKSWLGMGWKPSAEVVSYIAQTLEKQAAVQDRSEVEKTGVAAGFNAINPANNVEVPVWITNYVMGGVGTGAIMGVPAHDQRDFEFAKKFGLSITQVVRSKEQKTKYLVFDFDGVIGDTYDICNKSKMALDNLTHAEAVDSTIKYFNSKPDHSKGHNLSEAEMNSKLDWIRRYGEIMAKMDYSLFDDFNKVVASIPNTKIAIISAGSGLYIRNRIAETGLNPSHVLTYEDHHSKEEKIEQACKDWGVSMQEIYYFTDTKADVYELEHCIDRKKLIGCAWGYCGYDALRELLPEEQVLKEAKDINKIFAVEVYEDAGELVNSGKFTGMDSAKVKWEIAESVGGKRQVQFKLRDWVFSRQRYWGEPIPLVFCENCKKQEEIRNPKSEIRNLGWVPLPESELPLELPKVKKYQPTDTGESPLAAMEKWVNTKCPQCGGPAKRETDTMPNWAGSSWYYLAYALGGQKSKIKNQNYWNQELLKYWMPVDWYNGGMEHVVYILVFGIYFYTILV